MAAPLRNYRIKIQGYKQQITRNRSTKGGGLLVALRDGTDIDMIVTSINEEHEQMCIQFSNSSWKFNMCIAYGLQESRSSDDEIDSWYYNIEKTCTENEDNQFIIIGDLNSHIGNDEQGLKFNPPTINANGQRLRDLIDRRNLTLINGTKKCNGQWTRRDPNGTQSVLDMVIVNTDMEQNVVRMKIDEERQHTLTRYRKLNGKSCEIPSDHNTIFIELNLSKVKIKWKTVIWNMKDQEALNKFNKVTSYINVKENWNDDGNDADSKYKKWKKQWISVMYQCFRRITLKQAKGNTIVREKIAEKKRIKKEISKLNKAGIGKGIIATYMRSKLGTVIDEIATEVQNERACKLKDRMERAVKTSKANEIWRVRSDNTKKSDPRMAIQDKDGEVLTSKPAIMNRYEEYFKDLLKPRPPDSEAVDQIEDATQQFNLNMKTKSYDEDSINQPFTIEELNTAINQLKNNKCPGNDGMSNEMLKACGESMRKSILNMINWIWRNEELPADLKDLNIKSLYKGKGATSDLANHRGIFIGNALLIIYEKMISSRSSPVLESQGYTECQAGGRPNRGTGDHLFIVRALIDYATYFNSDIILQLLDLVKAFDTMQLKPVMNDMWHAGIKGKIWRNIYNINKESTIYIKTPFGPGKPVKIGETVKQGSVLASKMASLHTDGVNRLFQDTGLGMKYGNVVINNLIFQDDIIKFDTTQEKINESNQIYKWFSKINGMQFHPIKSEVVSNIKQELNIQLDGKEMKRVSSAKYLGDIITPDGKQDKTISSRRSAVTGITAEISVIMEEMIDAKFDATIQYYNGIVIPKLLNNAHTWSKLSKQNIQELEKVQNMTLKRLLKLPTGTPSVALKSELGIWSIKHQVLKQKLMYLHKIAHYHSEHLTKKVLIEQIALPGPTWHSMVKQECEEIGISIKISELQSMKKNQWQNSITDAIQKKENIDLEEWKTNSKKCSEMKGEVKFKDYLKNMKSEYGFIMLKERLGMTRVRVNYKNMYDSPLCPICKKQDETTKHMIRCNLDNPSHEIQELINNLENITQNINSSPKIDLEKMSVIIAQSIKNRASKLDASPPNQHPGGDSSYHVIVATSEMKMDIN